MNIMEGGSLLALGGIGAAVTAGWQHVKQIFTRISSLIIVTAKFDSLTSQAIIPYISLNYKILPSPIQYISSYSFPFKNKHYFPRVPFLVPANNSIRYGHKQILFLSGNQEALTVRSLRGMINFQNLTIQALQYFEADFDTLFKKVDRFRIIKMIGREKGVYAHEEKPTKNSAGEPLGNNDTRSDCYSINSEYMQSFMYPVAQYRWNTEEISPFTNLYYDQEVDKYIQQAKQWFKMGSWYTERSIPWRRGWLLHGAPGCGKSELAKAIAMELSIPLYVFHLTTMSDQEYIEKIASVQYPAVVLLEDLDNVFNGRENLTEHKSLSFDCLLNSMSGVSSPNGMFLIVTTNRLEYIDSALGVSQGKSGISTRPGRLDTVIKLTTMNEANRYKLANRILKDWPDIIPKIVAAGNNATPVQFQEMLTQYAFQVIANPTDTELPEFILPKQTLVKNARDYDLKEYDDVSSCASSLGLLSNRGVPVPKNMSLLKQQTDSMKASKHA